MAEIAWNKAGILKPGVPVASAWQLPEAERAVLAAYARDPAALAVAGRFLRLSGRARRRVVEYMDLLKLADKASSAEGE